MTRVKCYAGTRYPERPTAIEWQGAWLGVAEVSRQGRTPDGLIFWVRTADGRRFRLPWAVSTDTWQVEIEADGTRSIADG